jgi:hypothetical protein
MNNNNINNNKFENSFKLLEKSVNIDYITFKMKIQPNLFNNIINKQILNFLSEIIDKQHLFIEEIKQKYKKLIENFTYKKTLNNNNNNNLSIDCNISNSSIKIFKRNKSVENEFNKTFISENYNNFSLNKLNSNNNNIKNNNLFYNNNNINNFNNNNNEKILIKSNSVLNINNNNNINNNKKQIKNNKKSIDVYKFNKITENSLQFKLNSNKKTKKTSKKQKKS